MTRLAPLAPSPVRPTPESLLGELLELVAEACRDLDAAERIAVAREIAGRRARRARLAAYRERLARMPMLPVAAALARAAAAGDRAGVDAVLSRSRTQAEWRQVALILAEAADPARIPSAERPQRHLRRRS